MSFKLDQCRADIHDIRIGQLKDSMAGVADRYEEVIDLLKLMEEENLLCRRWMWINHGHKGIYGDDGEMQCGECWEKYGFWDWKRIPLVEIHDRIAQAVLRDAKGE